MGEYAEMMLDGTCCSQCGEFLECNFDLDNLDEDGCVIDTAPGFPMVCAACQDAAIVERQRAHKGERKKRRIRENREKPKGRK